MKLSHFINTLIGILLLSNCCAQDINWQSAKHWRLYDVHSKSAFTLPIDSLSQNKNIILNDDTMRLFTNEFQLLSKSEYNLWMGLFLVTCETNAGEVKKIIISNYGGFLYDPLARRYYELSEDMRDLWYEWLNEKNRSLVEDAKK